MGSLSSACLLRNTACRFIQMPAITPLPESPQSCTPRDRDGCLHGRGDPCMKFGSYRRPSALLSTLLAFATLVTVCSTDECFAASARRKVVIDQDAFGPAGSNLQAILML